MKRRNLLPVVSAIVACALFQGGSLSPSARAADRDARPAIAGTIRGEDGKPIPGASVNISTAGVRVGTSPFCPSCYADCRKRAKSNPGGEFSIGSLDPTLVFRVLFVAKGYEPKFVKVDPLKDKSLEVTLKSRPALPDDRRRIVSGQVVGPRGEPLMGALVEPFGCKIGEKRWWGSMPGVDPLAVTDEQGQFQIVAAQPVDGLDLEVTARALARKKFELVPIGAKVNRLQLAEGATVRGRVVDHGRPVAGVNVGLAQVDRGTNFFRAVEIGTDANGEFLFANVVANDNYYVYGIMSSLGKRGGIPEQRIHVGRDGSEVSAGDLTVEPAFRLSGQIVLSDRKPVPAHTLVLIDREAAWDSQLVEADADGAFFASGIPRGIISITASVPGYRPSQKNRSLERLNGSSLKGLMEKDIDGLLILLEPGKIEGSHWPLTQREYRSLERLKIEPPMGVPANWASSEPQAAEPIVIQLPVKPRKPLPKIDLPPPVDEPVSAATDGPKRIVRGRVVDEAGKPVPGAEVWLPVNWVRPNRYLTVHAKCANDGHFKLEFPIQWLPKTNAFLMSTGTLWAFAPEHCIGLANGNKQVLGEPDAKECEIRLGPPTDALLSVHLPDGSPAIGASLEGLQYVDNSNSYDQDVPAELLAKAVTKTDERGRVALSAFSRNRIDEVEVQAVGFGTQKFSLLYYAGGKAKWRDDLKLVPEGRIEGRVLAEQRDLLRDMVLSIETDDSDAGECKGVAIPTIDADGRFVIPKIASGWIEIYARLADERLPVRPRLIGSREIGVEPGTTTRLEIPLEMAVKAHGAIRVKGSGEPVTGARIYVHFGEGHQGDHVTSDAEGRFSAFVLPGQVNTQVIFTGRRDVTQLGDSRMAHFPVPGGVVDFELPPIEVVKVKTVSGRLLDKQSKPVANCRVDGLVGNSRYAWSNSDENGDFTLTGIPEELKLDGFEIALQKFGPPEKATVETSDPLVLRLK